MSKPRILIVGAGAAGYAAACKLFEYGFTNIKILEAGNRIGGRIHSVEFGTGIVDLGAQWCHGEKNNIVYEMVKNLNLLQHSQCNYQEFLFVDSQGNFVNSEVSGALMDLLFEISSDEELKLQNGSLGAYVIKKYDERLASDFPNIDRQVAKQIMDWFEKLINNLNACPNWFDLSANGTTHYEELEGDQSLNWKDKGYKTIFSVLKNAIPDPSKAIPIDENILFNKEVTRITWDDNKKKKNKGVFVECADGTNYTADHVITTVSLGVLKENFKTMFVPELPVFKINAIQGLSIGVVDKILLKFPKKWWPDECTGFDLIWSDEDIQKLIVDFSEGPTKNGKSWLQAIIGFHPIDYNPNVLLVFYNGEFAPEIESLSDTVVKDGCTYLLKTFLGKHFDIPNLDGILRSQWYTNKYFRGSYSYRSLETDRLQTSADDLAQPLGNNSVLFAGEATHSRFYSTVHGAIETGFREAQRILAEYRSGSKIKARL